MTLALTLLVLSQAQAPAALAGTWELDPDASDDPGPMMDLLGVPSALKFLAPKKPVQTIAVSNGTVTVSGNSMKGARSEVFTLDGKSASKAELMGVTVEYLVGVEGDAVVARGSIAIGDAGKQPLVTRRSVQGDRMTVVTTLGSTQFKRVFHRVEKPR